MSDKSAIEWTDASWNPVTGCTEVSPGCDHCYAETFAERFRGVPGHHFEQGFDLTLRPERLDQPLRWKRPRRIFVNSMSDLFHEGVPDNYIADVFAVMALAQQHSFQLLTKRHGRMRSLLSRESFRDAVAEEILARRPDGPSWIRLELREHWWPLPNVWAGVSVEDQHWADIRIPALLDTPAAVRWISVEPLLGRVDLTRITLTKPRPPYGPGAWLNALTGYVDGPDDVLPDRLDWVVVGGESGRGARPMQWHWARDLRDQCSAAGVPFLMKQSGTVAAGGRGKGGDPAGWPESFPREYPAARTGASA